jgi:hypothetical protein
MRATPEAASQRTVALLGSYATTRGGPP